MMIVILLGHIDLSVPWILTRRHDGDGGGGWWGVPARSPSRSASPSALLGLVNGLGVAFLRVPSMIFTLGMNAMLQGLMVLHTGGFAPQTRPPTLMDVWPGRTLLGIPNSLFVWIAVGVAIVFLLKRTPLGRYIYAIGNREHAAYLSGVKTAPCSSAASCSPACARRSPACCWRAFRTRPFRPWATRT